MKPASIVGWEATNSSHLANKLSGFDIPGDEFCNCCCWIVGDFSGRESTLLKELLQPAFCCCCCCNPTTIVYIPTALFGWIFHSKHLPRSYNVMSFLARISGDMALFSCDFYNCFNQIECWNRLVSSIVAIIVRQRMPHNVVVTMPCWNRLVSIIGYLLKIELSK